MQFALAAIKQVIPDLNKRPLTAEDFYRVCRRLKVKVHELPLRGIDGFYMVFRGKGHIYLDSRLRGVRWLMTAFHELGHALLHSPPSITVAFFCNVLDTKEDREAEAFASIALVPEPLLRRILKDKDYEHLALGEIDEEGEAREFDHGISRKMLEYRLQVLELYEM
jgi:Zn-dependent peptidase ImmA (M78 family)